MESKEEAEPQEEKPASPMWVLQQISEGAFRVAGEAIQSMYSGSATASSSGDGSGSSTSNTGPVGAHRRTQSELGTGGFQRSDSFQKLKSHVNRALRWGTKSREEVLPSTFNPEIMANQKRQWYQLHPKTLDCVNYKEPTSLFEHFVIVGLHPDANLEDVEHAFARRKKWEIEKIASECADHKMQQQQCPNDPTLEPQILFRYPPGKKLTVRMKDLASFCFPEGVKASVLERTPSLSELNELVYGQEHLGRDDLSFLFTLKASDSMTLYGICLHVPEIVQRPPAILGTSPSPPGVCSRFLVSAPRCYCLLTRVPFFELHFEMLNSLIAQERLNRITQFVNEMTLIGITPTTPKLDDQLSLNNDSPDRESFSDWMSCAIPVEGAAVLTAAAAGIISDDEIPQLSPKVWDSYPQSPASVSASDASDFFRDVEKDARKNMQDHDNSAFETPETNPMDRTNGTCESDQASPKVGTPLSVRSRALERIGSSESLFSPVRSTVSEDDDDLFANHDRDYGDDLLMEWATENKNDLLQIVCRYHAEPIPPRGSELIFHPLEHLQAIQYIRHSVAAALGFSENSLNCCKTSQVNAKLAADEEALALSIWTTATTCRVLSLECVLAFLAGVLLEKQVLVVSPNLGVLCATVLSIIPMIRPFQWQSLLLPVLPGSLLEFLDAPVPFIVGIQHMPDDWTMKNNSVVVTIPKDQVRMRHLPRLPKYRELVSQLSPIHARLAKESSVGRKHPVHRCNEVQAEAATQYLNIMWQYLESLCSDLKTHTITSVQSENDRVSLLLKDTFIESFPVRDQPFIKLFVDTQLFTVLSDSLISNYESGQS